MWQLDYPWLLLLLPLPWLGYRYLPDYREPIAPYACHFSAP